MKPVIHVCWRRLSLIDQPEMVNFSVLVSYITALQHGGGEGGVIEEIQSTESHFRDSHVLLLLQQYLNKAFPLPLLNVR